MEIEEEIIIKLALELQKMENKSATIKNNAMLIKKFLEDVLEKEKNK